jgi:NADP-dependent 3-hydroxy acid dehydrogenase YdfG
MAEWGPYARIAVVTGAARGVGAAVARRLALRGMRVALLGRELDSLRRVADELPTEAHCFEVDVTDEAALRGAARSIGARLGPASVVVANAGIAAAGPFATCEASLFDRVVEVNLGARTPPASSCPNSPAPRGTSSRWRPPRPSVRRR